MDAMLTHFWRIHIKFWKNFTRIPWSSNSWKSFWSKSHCISQEFHDHLRLIYWSGFSPLYLKLIGRILITTDWPRTQKMNSLKSFWDITTLKQLDFWAGEALEARKWGCFNTATAQNCQSFFKFLENRFHGLTKKQILSVISCKILFCQAGKLSSAKTWKRTQWFKFDIFT